MQTTEDEIRILFAKNLKEFRTKKNLSQMALAEKADVAANFINDIENCKKWISPATFSKLCNALELSPYEFFLPIQPISKSDSMAIQTFSAEVVNTIADSIAKISERY